MVPGIEGPESTQAKYPAAQMFQHLLFGSFIEESQARRTHPQGPEKKVTQLLLTRI